MKEEQTAYPWRRIAESGPVVNHTPGPWFMEFKVNADGDHQWRIGKARQGPHMSPTVTSAAAYVPYCCGPEQRHNAILVAAAPELFQTCAALFDRVKDRMSDEEAAKIHELLTRAYG